MNLPPICNYIELTTFDEGKHLVPLEMIGVVKEVIKSVPVSKNGHPSTETFIITTIQVCTFPWRVKETLSKIQTQINKARAKIISEQTKSNCDNV